MIFFTQGVLIKTENFYDFTKQGVLIKAEHIYDVTIPVKTEDINDFNIMDVLVKRKKHCIFIIKGVLVRKKIT